MSTLSLSLEELSRLGVTVRLPNTAKAPSVFFTSAPHPVAPPSPALAPITTSTQPLPYKVNFEIADDENGSVLHVFASPAQEQCSLLLNATTEKLQQSSLCPRKHQLLQEPPTSLEALNPSHQGSYTSFEDTIESEAQSSYPPFPSHGGSVKGNADPNMMSWSFGGGTRSLSPEACMMEPLYDDRPQPQAGIPIPPLLNEKKYDSLMHETPANYMAFAGMFMPSLQGLVHSDYSQYDLASVRLSMPPRSSFEHVSSSSSSEPSITSSPSSMASSSPSSSGFLSSSPSSFLSSSFPSRSSPPSNGGDTSKAPDALPTSGSSWRPQPSSTLPTGFRPDTVREYSPTLSDQESSNSGGGGGGNSGVGAYRRRLACLIPGCGRRFTSAYTLKVHTDAHHRPKARTAFACTLGCAETFSRQHDRLRHEVAKHGRVCDWLCPACGRFFSSKKTLGNHRCPCAPPGGTRWVTETALAES